MSSCARGWSIAAQLIGLAVVPALTMLVLVSIWLYGSRMDELRRDLDDRGRLLAVAVAQASRYGVIAGNAPWLQASLDSLLLSERSIASVEVTDGDGVMLAVTAAADTPPHVDDTLLFEQAIRLRPAASLEAFEDTPGFPTGGKVVGHVRVRMSTTPLVDAKRHELLLAGMFTLAAALFSGFVGLAIAQRLRRPLSGVMNAIREIRRGQYSMAAPIAASGELGELQLAIMAMAADLAVAHQDLEAKVATRTCELQAANEERRRLIAQGHVQVEDERRRIAIEFHDQLGAALIVLRMKAEHIAHLAPAGAQTASTHEASALAKELSTALGRLYEGARNLIKQLRPEVLDSLGLGRALEEMARHYDTLHPECSFSITAPADFPVLRGSSALAAYRVVQEALTNVVKHSCARHATIQLGWGGADNSLSVTVTDDGRGFDTTARLQGSLGVVGMRERVEAIGGVLAILSGQQGTTVSFTIPVPTQQRR